MKQVREKKRRWPGPRLGKGFEKFFGDLLDYARALGFEERPDYDMLRKGFERLTGNQVEDLHFRRYSCRYHFPPSDNFHSFHIRNNDSPPPASSFAWPLAHLPRPACLR
jgi:hypothetical protein